MFVVMIAPTPELFESVTQHGAAVFTLDADTAKTIDNLDSFLLSYSVPTNTLVVNPTSTTYTSKQYRVITPLTPSTALLYAASILGKPFNDRQLVFRSIQGYSVLGPSGYKAAANGTLKTTTHGVNRPARTSAQIAKEIGANPSRVWLTSTILHTVEDTLVVELEVPDIKLNDAKEKFIKHSHFPLADSAVIEHTDTTQVYAVKRFNSVVFTLVSSTPSLSIDYIISNA